LAFSPDSTKLAVGQTDGIVFIYKVGEDFKMKKSITNKLAQPSPVTFMVWPNEFEIICGLYDGKLRHTPVVAIKGPRSRTFYNPESYNVALACQ
jgi:intraflagellar transport protein 172